MKDRKDMKGVKGAVFRENGVFSGVPDSVWDFPDSDWELPDSVWDFPDSDWDIPDSVWGVPHSVWDFPD